MGVKPVCFVPGPGLQLQLGALRRQSQPRRLSTRNKGHWLYQNSSQNSSGAWIAQGSFSSNAGAAAARESSLSSEEPEFLGYTLEDEAEAAVEKFGILAAEAGKRLDKVLASRFEGMSRSYLQTLFDDGNVLLNGKAMTAKSHKPGEGDRIEIRFVTPQRELPITPENIPLDILYEDEHMVAVNKPAGMVVHPAPGNWTGTLVHALTYRYADIRRLGGPRPGIVHRLDKGTSGVVLAARTAEAQRGLMREFAQRRVRKEYIAVTVGNPAGAGCVARRVDEPVGRCPVDRTRMAVVPVEAGGKPAESWVTVEGRDGRGLLHAVRVEIATGRTHQIRVHLRHVRAPVLGDEVYGAGDVNRRFRTAAGRPQLHARRVRLRHPCTGAGLDVSAPLADDMGGLLGRVMPGVGERLGAG